MAADTAQSARIQSARMMSARLQAAQRAHLWRVAAWGGANVLGGLALAWGATRRQHPAYWNGGAMSAGWGAVNVGIATVGLLGVPATPLTDPSAVLAAERTFHDLLLFNLGLNVAYAAVGGTLLGAGYRGVTNAGRWRGFGAALIVQGVGLLVLDGVAFLASRTRLGALLASDGISVALGPSGLTLTVPL